MIQATHQLIEGKLARQALQNTARHNLCMINVDVNRVSQSWITVNQIPFLYGIPFHFKPADVRSR